MSKYERLDSSGRENYPGRRKEATLAFLALLGGIAVTKKMYPPIKDWLDTTGKDLLAKHSTEHPLIRALQEADPGLQESINGDPAGALKRWKANLQTTIGRRINIRALLYILKGLKRAETGSLALQNSGDGLSQLGAEFGLDPTTLIELLQAASHEAGNIKRSFYQKIREKIQADGLSVGLIQKTGENWQKIETIIEDRWPPQALAEARHGLRGEKPQSFLGIRKGDNLIGYLSFMAVESIDPEITDLGNLSLETIKAQQVNIASTGKEDLLAAIRGRTVMLTSTAVSRENSAFGSSSVFAAMLGLLDLAKKGNAFNAFAPAFSESALRKSYNQRKTYEECWLEEGTDGLPVDSWRLLLSLFGEEGPVNPNFMEIDIPEKQFLAMAGSAFMDKGCYYPSQSRAPIEYRGSEGCTAVIPAAWMILDKEIGRMNEGLLHL